MKLTCVAAASVAAVLAVACAFVYRFGIHISGYSIMLWNLPEQKLQDCDIVPVYNVKSNISHLYVIGLPGNKKKKIEVPMWQITEPQSLRKTKKLLAHYEEYVHKYAYVLLDGLPIRIEPSSSAKQIYRLRQNETVKLLYKGEGQPVMAGKKHLDGDWLMVLTDDGTQGWCFSNNLRQFAMDIDGKPIYDAIEAVDSKEVKDTVLDDMMSRKWYPDYYADMIQNNVIDISVMNESYGFDTGAISGSVTLATPDISVSRQYAGVVKTGQNVYSFTDTPFTVTVQGTDDIVVRYMTEEGKPRDYKMISLPQNIDELVAAETKRREDELRMIREHGPAFMSFNYGTLLLYDDNSFRWTYHNLLSPSIIPHEAGDTGVMSIKYFLDNSLKGQYDGVITLEFDDASFDINFLYKIEDGGLRMEDASKAAIEDNVVKLRGRNPLIIFFER